MNLPEGLEGAAVNPTTEDERTKSRPWSLYSFLCSVQGVYYLVTGVWPLVSIETFQAVTGPKTDHLVTGRESDHWLVNVVAALIVVNALVLLLAAWRNRPTPEVALLAVGSAVGLTAIDVIYVSRDVIDPIYLADAAAESVLVIAWLWVAAGWFRRGETPRTLAGRIAAAATN